jgi:HSP20 family protein
MTSLTRRSDWPLLSGSLFNDFFDDDRFFNSPWLRGQSIPAVNVKENEKGYEVEVAAPGFNKKDFNVAIENNCLTISAEKKDEKEQKENNYTRREFGYTSFSRTFSLPENIHEEDIKAHYEDGVLKLSLAKKELSQVKPKKAIDIK